MFFAEITGRMNVPRPARELRTLASDKERRVLSTASMNVTLTVPWHPCSEAHEYATTLQFGPSLPCKGIREMLTTPAWCCSPWGSCCPSAHPPSTTIKSDGRSLSSRVMESTDTSMFGATTKTAAERLRVSGASSAMERYWTDTLVVAGRLMRFGCALCS